MTLGVLVACSAQQAPTQAATPAPVACTDPKVEDEWLQHPAGLCGMPEDVRKRVDDYDTCEHFAGEEPYDADRRHEIEVAVAQFCTPAPARLARLMQQYRTTRMSANGCVSMRSKRICNQPAEACGWIPFPSGEGGA
ncbi:hypothetical protein C8F00_0602 [Xanthomonas vasicola]